MNVLRSIVQKTDRVKTFCCCVALIYPASYQVMKRDDFTLAASAGSDRRFIQKYEQTFVTVDLAVLPVSISVLVLPYLFRRYMLTNVDSMNACESRLYFVSYSSLIPMSTRNLFHWSKHAFYFLMDSFAMPAF